MEFSEPTAEMGRVLRLARGQPDRLSTPRPATRRVLNTVSPIEMIGRLAVLEGSALFFNENAATLRTLARRARLPLFGSALRFMSGHLSHFSGALAGTGRSCKSRARQMRGGLRSQGHAAHSHRPQ